MRYIGRHAQMDTPLKSRPALGPIPPLEARHRTAILGSVTIPGRAEDGSVTVVMVDVPDGVLIEVIDDGSAGTPVVKCDLFAADGHGLYLVQQLAAQWGYLRDPAGTTVWFHLANRGDG
jgi:hypothetical protein